MATRLDRVPVSFRSDEWATKTMRVLSSASKRRASGALKLRHFQPERELTDLHVTDVADVNANPSECSKKEIEVFRRVFPLAAHLLPGAARP
jgi:hypothetical protein